MNHNLYFILFPCCIPVKGFNRSVICDVQRGSFDIIPNGLYDLLLECNGKTIQDTCEYYGEFNSDTILDYYDFLVENEYGYLSHTYEELPKISMHWDSPKTITNSILDFDISTTYSLETVVSELNNLLCEGVEIRFFFPLSITDLSKRLVPFYDTTIRSVTIIVGSHPTLTEQNLRSFLLENPKVRKIIIHSSDSDSMSEIDIRTRLIHTKQIINSEHCCGNVSPYNFISEIDFFAESLIHNNCLNRKVSIDRKGEIRNCPSMTTSYGNIKNIKLSRAVHQKDFKQMWDVSKNEISICKDCEFRYICHDCRAYVSDKSNKLSKPEKCNYDPYKNVWT